MEREKEDRLIGQLREQANDLLAAVHLLTPLVRSQGAEKDTQCLAAMNQSLYRLIRCVNHMELCRESQPLFHPALLDLAGLCRDMGRQLELLEDALQVHFWWGLEKESIITLADDALLEQAIWNLISNAVEAAGPGGHVTLRCVTDGERCRIMVSDDGPGLKGPAPVQDPFLKTPGGVGLGLEAARWAASLHGGALVLENREEGGLRAVLSLPIRKDDGSGGVRTPRMGYDRTGGFSPMLVELSPLLPMSYFRWEETE